MDWCFDDMDKVTIIGLSTSNRISALDIAQFADLSINQEDNMQEAYDSIGNCFCQTRISSKMSFTLPRYKAPVLYQRIIEDYYSKLLIRTAQAEIIFEEFSTRISEIDKTIEIFSSEFKIYVKRDCFDKLVNDILKSTVILAAVEDKNTGEKLIIELQEAIPNDTIIKCKLIENLPYHNSAMAIPNFLDKSEVVFCATGENERTFKILEVTNWFPRSNPWNNMKKFFYNKYNYPVGLETLMAVCIRKIEEKEKQNFKLVGLNGEIYDLGVITSEQSSVLKQTVDISEEDIKRLLQSSNSNIGLQLNSISDYIEAAPYVGTSYIDNMICTSAKYNIQAFKEDGTVNKEDWDKTVEYYRNAKENLLSRKKEENKMNNIFKDMNFTFGKFEGNEIAYSYNGIAFKNVNGSYSTYNIETNTMTNVSDMIIKIPIYVLPVAKAALKPGDVIIFKSKIYVVKENKEDSINAVDPVAGVSADLIPEKSLFGFDYYSRVLNIMDSFSANAENPFGNMLPFMLMDKEGDNSMAMMMLAMQGNNNINTMLPFFMMKDKEFDPMMFFLFNQMNK